jgi:glycosyltransferase involved in cell wall biosynthesis
MTSGAITISAYLTGWANGEYARQGRSIVATEVPILVDTNEIVPTSHRISAPKALYAASSGYDDSLDFVLRSMRHVWKRWPDSLLVVTGMTPVKLASEMGKLELTPTETARVVATGWLDRDSLLRMYSESSVCLAPLFGDQRSGARFPTKIGEYAAAGRPIVTSAVGEARRYLEDRVNAFVAEPDDAASFAGKILEVFSDPGLATAVGGRARHLAENVFDYHVHAGRLHECMALALDNFSNQPERSPA